MTNVSNPRSASIPLLNSRFIWILAALLLMWWLAFSKKASDPIRALNTKTHTTNSSNLPTIEGQTLSVPSNIERVMLAPASRDPFTAYQTPLPPAPKPKLKPPPAPTVAIQPPAVQAAPAPTPPNMSLRYVGQITTSDGGRLIYAALGEETLALTQGSTLPNGYQVTRIEPRQVILTFAPLNYNTQLAIPEPPRYEIR